MRYFQAITDQFRGEKWVENLLFVSVCVLIPFIGPILLIGYCTYGIASTRNQPFAPWPRFNFDRFSDYLATGVWPFLVSLAISALVMPLLFLVLAPMFVAASLQEEISDTGLILAFAATFVLYLSALVLLTLITWPMILRSALEQNFSSAFNARYIRGFIARVWKEMILTQFFILFISIPLVLIGYLMFFVGVFPAVAVMTVGQWHLKHQLYTLYLERGGEPIAISEKLLNGPLETPKAPPPPELPAH